MTRVRRTVGVVPVSWFWVRNRQIVARNRVSACRSDLSNQQLRSKHMGQAKRAWCVHDGVR